MQPVPRAGGWCLCDDLEGRCLLRFCPTGTLFRSGFCFCGGGGGLASRSLDGIAWRACRASCRTESEPRPTGERVRRRRQTRPCCASRLKGEKVWTWRQSSLHRALLLTGGLHHDFRCLPPAAKRLPPDAGRLPLDEARHGRRAKVPAAALRASPEERPAAEEPVGARCGPEGGSLVIRRRFSGRVIKGPAFWNAGKQAPGGVARRPLKALFGIVDKKGRNAR